MNNNTLFDYQKEMVKRVQEAFRNHQSVMVQMPTGTGKTHLLAAVVKSEELNSHDGQKYRNACVWIVAHRRELVAQIEETLARFDSSLYSFHSTLQKNSSLSSLNSSLIRVMSIQWLSHHYREMNEEPSMIVIDEAHHAVADTYAEVMRAFPKAKKLGLTATPCRLNGSGFTNLFDVLLTSWSIERFIAEGRLCLYDYYSIKPDSQDQLLVDSLKARGADGDYLQKEMSEVMDVRPSLERLCLTLKRFAPQKKGIVYAISIAHAEHIAEVYRQNGISAVAISSQTPKEKRKELIEIFKNTPKTSSLSTLHSSLPIQVLVSVDLFSEGFDCPDVEFIQLARPTLSLSKYLQMVGRGLRIADGKDCCTILDNVGLYRRFGLPSDDRDWQSMFEGRQLLQEALQEACMRINSRCSLWESYGMDSEEMVKIFEHNRLRSGKEIDFVRTMDKNGMTIWRDALTGLCFKHRPQCIRLLGIDFCTDDGYKLFPRVRSAFIDDKAYLTLKTIELQVGCGLNWKRRFIPFAQPNRVYLLKDKQGNMRLYEDEQHQLYVQANPDMLPTHISSQDEINDYCQRYSLNEKSELQAHNNRYRHGLLYPIFDAKAMKNDGVKKGNDDIWFVSSDEHGESFWVDGITGMKHYDKPTAQKRGFVKLLRDGDWYFIRNIPDITTKALRSWQIVADDNLCVVDNKYLFLKRSPRLWYKIQRRSDDFSYFVVKELRGDGDTPDIIITQSSDNELKIGFFR